MPMISLQISQELMDEFDKVWEKLNVSSRSEALRESIQFFIKQHSRSVPIEGFKIAVLHIHHFLREDILDRFSEYIQKYENIVKSITSYNLKKNIVKILIVSGPAQEINDLYTTLLADRLFATTISYLIIPETHEEQEKIQNNLKE